MGIETAMHRWLLLAGILSAVTATGCGPEYHIVPVSGVITRGGEPVKDLLVTFQPMGGTISEPVGPASYGHTDEQGRYTLKIIHDHQDGAIVGTHRVILRHRNRMAQSREELDKLYEEGASDKEIQAAALEYELANQRAQANVARMSLMVPRRFRDGSITFQVQAAGSTEANFDLSRRP